MFGVQDFTIDKPATATGNRRPPVVLSRPEVAAVFAHLAQPWKLAAQLMYGSGLRVIECMRLSAKDLDFDQGTITIHDGKGGKHRVVPLPKALDHDLSPRHGTPGCRRPKPAGYCVDSRNSPKHEFFRQLRNFLLQFSPWQDLRNGIKPAL